MTAPGVCQRCGALTALVVRAPVRLCARCPVQPVCAAFAHDYAGSPEPGRWVCRLCLTTLDPGPHPDPAPAAPVADVWEC